MTEDHDIQPTIFEVQMAHHILEMAIEQHVLGMDPVWMIVAINPDEPEKLTTDLLTNEELLELELAWDDEPLTEEKLFELYDDPSHSFLVWDELVLIPMKPDIAHDEFVVRSVRDTLCWILGHKENGEIFEQNLMSMQGLLGDNDERQADDGGTEG